MTTETILDPRDPAAAGAAAEVRVALVEDDSGLRRSLERLLNLSPGYRCTCSCGSGEEALKLIPRTPPDLVLMDIHLPNRSGIECTALLRQQLPQLQIIMLTVYDDADTLFKALRAGACGYLLKRARPGEILEAISEARRGAHVQRDRPPGCGSLPGAGARRQPGRRPLSPGARNPGPSLARVCE